METRDSDSEFAVSVWRVACVVCESVSGNETCNCKVKNIKFKKILSIMIGRVAGYLGWNFPTRNPTEHRLDGFNFYRVIRVVFSSVFSVFNWTG